MANIPSQKKIVGALKETGSPLSIAQLCRLLKVLAPERKTFKRGLRKMIGRKLIVKNKNGTYRLWVERISPEKKLRSSQTLSPGESLIGRLKVKGGKYKIHVLKGETREKEVYGVNEENINGAVAGELVSFQLKKSEEGKEGIVIISGTLGRSDSFASISKKFLSANDLKPNFPYKVKQEVELVEEVFKKALGNKNRIDLRAERVITIDPRGARDHDDALSLRRTPSGGWVLTVHIADVAEFVSSHSALDNEAAQRAYTNYLPWMSVPMLPEKLSTNLCSLKENEERLALSCKIHFNGGGRVTRYSFFESIICVKSFYTYEHAQKLFDSGDEYFKKFAEFARLLNKRRVDDGLMEFSFPEPKVILGEDGAPETIELTNRCEAYNWIEECMLIANQCTAKFLTKNKLPGMYRVHEFPEKEAIQELLQIETILDQLGTGNTPSLLKHSKFDEDEIRNFYLKLVNNPVSSNSGTLQLSLQRMILRTMKKAQYSVDSLGHFALGWKDYAHFTSPIRRYADLWNHRMIKLFLRGKPLDKNDLQEAIDRANSISEKELEVQKIERRGMKSSTAWILRDYIGQEFEGVVNGLDKFGIYVLLNNKILYGEGWLGLARLKDDYYEFNPEAMQTVGRRRKKVFKMGDKIKVRVASADPVSSKVDFDLVR